ncbi:MAG: phytoene desaturase [Candidatus Kapabacteria bacterium]|nr:phytoene desaturase [Candidatus Kapabacteria bacterium]
MKQRRAVVIGAGIGGMTAALELQRSGFRVVCIEKNPMVGGKMYRHSFAECHFDTGPSLVTMPFVFKEFFHRHGADFTSMVDLMNVEPGCRYKWLDGSQLDVSSDTDTLLSAVEKFSPDDVKAVAKYMQHSARVYEATKDVFLFNEFNGFRELFRLKNFKLLRHLPALRSHQSLHSFHTSMFRSGKLIQLFDRFATYNGSSPYSAPATLAVIPHVELAFGAWYPRGGLYSIAKAFQALCDQSGVEMYTSRTVSAITHANGVVRGVQCDDGEYIEADVVVSNSDVYHTHRSLIGVPYKKERELSCSGFTLLLAVKQQERHLIHHNILFSDDYKQEFEEIFRKKTAVRRPTIYIANSSFSDSTQAADGLENWFILVNAPSTSDDIRWADIAEEYADSIISQMKGYGIDCAGDIIERQVRTPATFSAEHTAFRGSLYGSSSNSMFSAFLRPRNRSPYFKNLYFSGGTTHPGGGVPLVVLSGRIAAACIRKDFSLFE